MQRLLPEAFIVNLNTDHSHIPVSIRRFREEIQIHQVSQVSYQESSEFG
jgi:hypothetical protein